RPKYIHHSDAVSTKPTTKAPTTEARQLRPANVAPIARIDSPSAMRGTSWLRSARWPPASVQSPIGVRPSRGKAKPCSGAAVVERDRGDPDEELRAAVRERPD